MLRFGYENQIEAQDKEMKELGEHIEMFKTAIERVAFEKKIKLPRLYRGCKLQESKKYLDQFEMGMQSVGMIYNITRIEE